MTFRADQPVTEPEDDRLGRTELAKALGKALLETTGTVSMVIGMDEERRDTSPISGRPHQHRSDRLIVCDGRQ